MGFMGQFASALLALAGAIGLWWLKEYLTHLRTRTVVTKALLTELRNLMIAFRQRHWWWTTLVSPDDQWLPPLVDFSTKVYDRYVANLGELDDKIAGKLVIFHGFVAFLNDLQKTREAYLAGGQGEAFYDQYHAALDGQIRLRGFAEYDAILREEGLAASDQSQLPPILDSTVDAAVLADCRATDATQSPARPAESSLRDRRADHARASKRSKRASGASKRAKKKGEG